MRSRAPDAGDAVTLTFADEIDVARGDLLAGASARAEFADQFAAHLIWMKDEPLVPGRSYWLKIGTRTVPATVTALKHRIDVDTRRACRRAHPRAQRDRLLQPVDRAADRLRPATPTTATPAALS